MTRLPPTLLAALVVLTAPAHASVAPAVITTQIREDLPGLMALYRDLHANPELSFQEVRTAASLAARIRALGFEVTEKIGRTGVVAILRNGPGPVLMIRADMDGLPVVEQTGLSFASKVRATTREGVESGVMHACGHDTHMTAWIETASLMARHRPEWSGTLMMVLQPAEEIGEGAAAMIADGLLTRFARPTHAIAFHDSASLPAGTIGYTPGFAFANVDSVDILVRGVGGHGAYPHAAKDPIILGARIVTALQTLISRERDPQDPAVITVGAFHAGAKHNIIPDSATLLLTVRSYSDETRKALLDGIARVVRGEAIAAGMGEDSMPHIKVADPYTPAAFNVADFTESRMVALASKMNGTAVMKIPPVMAGEDFGRYYRADPNLKSMIFWVGGVPADQWTKSANGKLPLPSLHAPVWAPDAERVIATAAQALTLTALDILKK